MKVKIYDDGDYEKTVLKGIDYVDNTPSGCVMCYNKETLVYHVAASEYQSYSVEMEDGENPCASVSPSDKE